MRIQKCNDIAYQVYFRFRQMPQRNTGGSTQALDAAPSPFILCIFMQSFPNNRLAALSPRFGLEPPWEILDVLLLKIETDV